LLPSNAAAYESVFARAENLIEENKTKGTTVSIYLNAESLRYLDQLVKMQKAAGHKAGRSEMVQQLIIQCRNASLAFLQMLGEDDKSPVAENIRKMAGVKE
jgi:hypothetical protein